MDTRPLPGVLGANIGAKAFGAKNGCYFSAQHFSAHTCCRLSGTFLRRAGDVNPLNNHTSHFPTGINPNGVDLIAYLPRWGSPPSSDDHDQRRSPEYVFATHGTGLRGAMINGITAPCGQAAMVVSNHVSCLTGCDHSLTGTSLCS